MTHDFLNRFMPCKCIRTSKDEFVPFWLADFVEGDDVYEHKYKVNGDWQEYSNTSIVDCYWDIVDKKIVTGEVKDIYPEINELPFKEGEKVLREAQSKNWKRKVHTFDEIEKIIFDEFDRNILKGKDVDEYYSEFFSKEELVNKDALYEIRIWKPAYKLKSGVIIRWDHQLSIIEE